MEDEILMTNSPTSSPTKRTADISGNGSESQSDSAIASNTLVHNPYVITFLIIIAVLVCLILALICCMCIKSKQKKRKDKIRKALELGQFSSGLSMNDDDVLNEGDGLTTLPNNNTMTTNKDLTRTVSPTLASIDSNDAGLTIVNYAISDNDNDTPSDHDNLHSAYNHNMPHLIKDSNANGTLDTISTMIQYSIHSSPASIAPQYPYQQNQNLPNGGFIDQHGALSNIVDELPPPPGYVLCFLFMFE